MMWNMLSQSWKHSPRRKVLAVLTIFLAASLISALLAVSINIGDKMSRELKSYGANIVIEPAGQAAIPEELRQNKAQIMGQTYLSESELPNIKDIFWRNNIIGFAPQLSGYVTVNQQSIRVLGTYFNKQINIPDEDDYHTGQQVISPFWLITGQWPQELANSAPETLVGHELAKRNHWKTGDLLTIKNGANALMVTVSGILTSGADEDNQLVMPLAVVQSLLDLPGKVQSIRVSALTVPENALSRKARTDPDSLTAEEYDRWYCTAFVSSITYQLEEAISGANVHPVWQVAASEGIIIDKIQLLMAVVTLAALAAASMGIASLMSSTIIERAKEIGLMKALGAHQWQIMLLFYLDAALGGMIGGAAGCIAGWGLAKQIGMMLFNAPLEFPWIVVPCVLLVSVLIALIGTRVSAHRISELYPVEVLYGR